MCGDDPLGEFYFLWSEEILSKIHSIATFLSETPDRRELRRMGWERSEILERVRMFVAKDSKVFWEGGGHRTSLVGDLLVEKGVIWGDVPVVGSELNEGILGELLS